MELPNFRLPDVRVIAGLTAASSIRAALAKTCPDIRLEPDQTPPHPGGMLCVETAGGRSLNHSGVLASAWHRPPYALAIRLVRYAPGSLVPEIVDHAVIGTRGPRNEFFQRAEQTAFRLVEDTLLGRGRGAPDAGLPTPSASRLVGGWLDHMRSSWADRILSEWWSLGYSTTPLFDIVDSGRLGTVTWLQPRKGSTYLADPFPWPATGRILCEEMPMAGGQGRIVAISADGSALQNNLTILQDQQHHSYPCTFTEDGVTWLLPEATEQGTTVLYRLDGEGGLTPVCAVAPRQRLSDPTLFRHAGRYWIACTDLEVGAHDNLCLFHASRLEGPWQPHRLHPVRIDIRGARPAGALFHVGSTLFRPAQNCAATYGAAITIHRVDTLTPDEYRETAVAALYPDPKGPFPHGLHTLVSDGSRTWIDGKRFVLDWPTVARKVWRRMLRRRVPAPSRDGTYGVVDHEGQPA